AGDSTGRVCLWDTTDGRCRVTIQNDSAVRSVAFSPDGRLLATGARDASVRLWGVEDGQCRATPEPPNDYLRNALLNLFMPVAFSPNGRLLATGVHREVRIRDLTDGRCRATSDQHTREVKSVSFSPDGRLLATGDSTGRICLWSTADGRCHINHLIEGG